MKYFIPAWYTSNEWWRDRARPDYEAIHSRSEFDDLISLMGMHTKNEKKFKMIILNFFSDLRTFMHRNQLFEVDYWSVFDEIQGFDNVTPQPIDYQKLAWPEGTDFIYTPFIIRAITSKETYTNIYYSPMGYLMWLDFYEHNEMTKRCIFDDRGILSAIIECNNEGSPILFKILNYLGDVVLTENLLTYKVTVSETYYKDFKQKNYDTMVELIKEKFAAYISRLDETAHYIVGADVRHNNLINNLIRNEKLTYSVFTKRNKSLNNDLLTTIQEAEHCIVDTEDNEDKLKSEEMNEVLRITPFSTLVLPNLSSQLYESYVGINIDGLDEDIIVTILNSVFEFIKENERIKVILISRSHENNRSYLSDMIHDINQYFIEQEDDIDLLDEKEKNKLEVIKLLVCPFENDVIKAIAKLRILVDLNVEPDLFLQICSISAGIPQINVRKTDYVEVGVNGLIVRNNEEMIKGIAHYLLVLKHWNKSLSYSMKLSQKYSSINIINELEQFIEGGFDEKTF
ncbi:accessory Sec system protein Asp1 [Macrococcus epidermidis]|uniref:accessory Sec system protein Asp1 n=1 Tax=Macrococcus epidermidis TaxID=1902580 RepID=UPI00360642B8